MEGKKALSAITEKLKSVKYPLIVLLVGLALLLLPTGKSGGKDAKSESSGGAPDPAAPTAGTGDEGDLEKELEEMLSLIDGAGQVRVLLTPVTDGEKVLARDSVTSSESRDGETRSENSDSAVVLQSSGGGSETVEVSYVYPEYRGAVVAAQGAEDPKVELEILEAVKAATGLGGDAVKVVKMK